MMIHHFRITESDMYKIPKVAVNMADLNRMKNFSHPYVSDALCKNTVTKDIMGS